ncbi:MAG: chemotaxis protein CheX [Phycisphaeraceae bacterium JB051]
MQLDTKQPMIDVFCRVMESMAFYFVDPVDKADVNVDALDMPYRQLSMRFEGPHHGSLVMYIPQSMTPVIWANMLGVDEEEAQDSEQQNDAICELLNVICGQTLTELWGTEPVFDLQVPQLQNLDQTSLVQTLTRPSTCCFSSDDGIILLEIHVDE